jgi:capsular exopolysaccharide synthesis family protein
MTEYNDNDRLQDQAAQDELPIFNYKRLVSELISHWYLFILFLAIGLTGAWLYNRYTSVMYAARTSIMILEEGSTTFWRQGGGFSGEALRGFGTSYQGISNQMIIMKSQPVVARAIRELGFEVSYHNEGKLSTAENYTDAAFRVEWDRNHPQLIGFDFKIAVHPDRSITLSGTGEGVSAYSYAENRWVGGYSSISIDRKVQSGEEVIIPGQCSFIIHLNEGFIPPATDYFFFRFHTPEELVATYRSRLTVSLRDWETSIVDIDLKDFHPQKAVDFLNKLVEVYRIDNVERKNEYADQTINFIEYLLEGVSDSLSVAEGKLLTFQSDHKIIDIGSQTGQLLGQMNELDQRKQELETEIKYYRYLKNYILTNRDIGAMLAPSSVGISDPLLGGLIGEFNTLTVEKSKLADVKISPRLTQLNAQLENVKAAMLENIDNILTQNDQMMADLNRRQSLVEARVGRLPVTERDLLNIERKYNMSNDTYTFLLEKLSEAQIAKAANQPESQVVEEASSLGQVGPQTNKAYSYGLFAGIVPPALYVLLLVLFNNKVISKEDVENLTRLPILNMVFFNKQKIPTNTPVLDKPNSPDSEAYRSLRGKLDLMTKGKPKPVIAVSSTGPGEGKTYTAINIASSYALAKRKTLLLDFDLRNSRINKDFQLDGSKGVVSFILGKDSLSQITHPTKHPFLSIIPAGPIPPNPGEMLMDDKVRRMLNELKESYDVIVIDSAPIGYVTDLFQITDLIDSTVFVIRDSYTNRKLLKQALDEIKMYKIKGVGILINAIKTTGGLFPAYVLSYVNGYRYGYGYGYGDYGYGGGYGYGYYGYGNKNKRKRFKFPMSAEEKAEESLEEENGTHNGRPHV